MVLQNRVDYLLMHVCIKLVDLDKEYSVYGGGASEKNRRRFVLLVIAGKCSSRHEQKNIKKYIIGTLKKDENIKHSCTNNWKMADMMKR